MSLQVDRLSKEVLTSYENTRTFLEGKSAIGEIAKQRELFVQQPLFFTTQRSNPGRCWRILHVLTYSIRRIIALYMCLLGNIPYPLCIRVHRIGKRIKAGFRNFPPPTKTRTYAIGPCKDEDKLPEILSLMLRAANIRKKIILPSQTSVSFLNISENALSKELDAVTTLPPIPITDPRLRKRLFDNAANLKLPTGGICRGMAVWFMYLYLQTQHLFATPEKQMIVLCQQFAKGAPLEAVLLQGLNPRKWKLLNCNIGEQDSDWPKWALSIGLTTSKGDRQIIDPKRIEKELGDLKPGSYMCHFPTHAAAYIKITSTLGFWFDPSLGIIEIRGPAQGAKLFRCVNLPIYFGNEKEHTPPFIRLFSVKLRDTAPHIGA